MAIISPCRGTTEDWNEANPILNEGEVGVERKGDGTCITRIGDGEHHFFDLPVLADSGAFSRLNETGASAEKAAADASEAAKNANEVYDRLKDTDLSGMEEELTALQAGLEEHIENSNLNLAAHTHRLDNLPVKKTGFRYLRDCLCGSMEADTCHWVSGELWADGVNVAKDISVTANFTPTTGDLRDYTNGSNDRNAIISAVADQQWRYLQLDLGKIRYDIDTIKIYHYWNDAGRQYNHKLLVSDDAKTWYTLFDSDQQGSYQESKEGRIHYLNPTYLERTLQDKVDQSRLSDSGWVSLTLLPNFSLYVENEPLKARRIGNIVEIAGRIVSNKNNNVNSPSPIPVAYLPQEMTPAIDCRTLCQGSDMNRCLISAYNDPDDPISASRFGSGNYASSITGNEWIMVQVTYTV